MLFEFDQIWSCLLIFLENQREWHELIGVSIGYGCKNTWDIRIPHVWRTNRFIWMAGYDSSKSYTTILIPSIQFIGHNPSSHYVQSFDSENPYWVSQNPSKCQFKSTNPIRISLEPHPTSQPWAWFFPENTMEHPELDGQNMSKPWFLWSIQWLQLLGALEHDWIMTFPSYWEWNIIPTDELTPSFFRGVRSTTNQVYNI